FDAALPEEHDGRPVGEQSVAQEDVPGAEHVPQPAEQADLALPLAGILAEPEVHDRPARQRDHRPNPRDREAEPGLLVVDLRVGRLVLPGVGHRDCRAVEQVHPPPLPQPAPVGLIVQAAADGTGHVGEERLRQALPRLAVGAGLGGAGPLPPRQAVGDQPCDGGAGGGVGAEGLSQGDPERDQGGKDPVQAAADRGQGLRNNLFREDIGERQLLVLKELPPQKAHLVAERCWVTMAHPGASWARMAWLLSAIFGKEALFAYVSITFRLAEIYGPFVDGTDARNAAGHRDSGGQGRRRSGGARRTWRGGATAARAGRQADDELGARARAVAAGRDAAAVQLDQGL